MEHIPIRLLVTDLDNTLYDWISAFVPAFYAMVEEACNLLDVEKEELLDQLREVHRRYRNSEQPFALLEVPAVERKYPGETREKLARVLDPAFHTFNRVRKERLTVYPGVKETLEKIRATGCIVVAHTEAVVENSLYRLESLRLLGDIERLYAPGGVGINHPFPEQMKRFEALWHMVQILPSLHRKPDPRVLSDICVDYSVDSAAVLYVGDRISRDVVMARLARVKAAWAEYGTRFDERLWEKLVRVTHRTEEDVERDKKLERKFKDVRPDVTLRAFSDLLGPLITEKGTVLFEFGRP